MYHKVDLIAPTEWWVDVNNFYQQMLSLKHKEVVTLDRYDTGNPNHVVITFDGVYKNVLEYAVPIMHQLKYPFELFITSDYIGRDNAFDTVEPSCEFASIEDLLKMEKYGGRIQWHTQSHIDLLNISDLDVIRKELSIPENLKIFNSNSFRYFAYPYGNYNDIVKEQTKLIYKGAISCNQGSDIDNFALNRITMTNDSKLFHKSITCIIPCYNYGSLLPDAIESVLRQTHLPEEIIIADDASIDNTLEIAKYYQIKHPHLIKIISNSKNLGIVDNFNNAITQSKGDFIVFLGADNLFYSNYTEECYHKLNSDDLIDVAYTDFKLFGPGASKLYNKFPDNYKGKIENDHFEINFPDVENIDFLQELNERNFIHGSSMFRRTAFDRIGGYINDSHKPEDYNLFLRLAKNGSVFKKATNTYLLYRQHSTFQANNIFGIKIMMEHYMIRNKELERELNIYKKYGLIKLISFLHNLKVNTQKARAFFKKNGFKPTITKIANKIR